MAAGQVINNSSKTLWVVETEAGSANAHLLPPGHRSPGHVDVDGVRAEDGTPIEGHDNWWKVWSRWGLSNTAVITDSAGGDLAIDCQGIPPCTKKEEQEFGDVTFLRGEESWGERVPPPEERESGRWSIGCIGALLVGVVVILVVIFVVRRRG